MKKILLYVSCLTAMLAVASCTEDYNAEVAEPQAWEQEEAIDMPTLTVASVADIDLETNTDENVTLFTYSVGELPEGATLSDLSLTVAGSAMNHTDGAVNADELQALIESIWGKAREQRELTIDVTASIIVDVETYYLGASTSVNVTPLDVPFYEGIPEFYLVGGLQGWDNTSKGAAFYPIVAVEGTASYTTNFSTYQDGTTGTPNFKIFSLEQIGSWDNCYGAATDGDTSLEGLITFNGGAIQCPTNDYYTLTINMLYDTYTFELLEDQAPTSYTSLGLIGGFNSWAEQKAMTEVTAHNWCIEGFVLSEEVELKFRANDDWGISWGNTQNMGETSYGYMADGGNITVPAGTYNVYFNDITTQAFFVVQ